jgi:hypothetical protein
MLDVMVFIDAAHERNCLITGTESPFTGVA